MMMKWVLGEVGHVCLGMACFLYLHFINDKEIPGRGCNFLLNKIIFPTSPLPQKVNWAFPYMFTLIRAEGLSLIRLTPFLDPIMWRLSQVGV